MGQNTPKQALERSGLAGSAVRLDRGVSRRRSSQALLHAAKPTRRARRIMTITRHADAVHEVADDGLGRAELAGLEERLADARGGPGPGRPAP